MQILEGMIENATSTESSEDAEEVLRMRLKICLLYTSDAADDPLCV